ncbi:MAG: lysophospholipid acyltransferase family protein [Pseudomonadota bacterium]
MSQTWYGAAEPALEKITLAGWIRVAARGVPLAVTVFGGLLLLLSLRLIEAPVFRNRRPITPIVTQAVCKTSLFIMGLRVDRIGQPFQGPGALVSNHVSWLDVFVLNATQRVYFVSKAEVAGWPGIGWLARATGTVFISREARDASRQRDQFATRLSHGHLLLFFPEGTSTDGRQVLSFKPTLFAAFFTRGAPLGMALQAVTLAYRAPEDADPSFYGWWGSMAFGPHLIRVLATARNGSAAVVFHPRREVADFEGRKDIAAALEADCRSGLPGGAG